MKIRAERLYEKDASRGAVSLQRSYTDPQGVRCRETMAIQRESDYVNEQFSRISEDNGRTWGPWEREKRESYSRFFGEDELMTEETRRVYNPLHGHYVGTLFTRYCLDGHRAAYRREWEEGASPFLAETWRYTISPDA